MLLSVPLMRQNVVGSSSPETSSQNFSSSQCNIQGTTLKVASQPYHTGDITVQAGQSYLIANMNFNMLGNFIVNGGVLIIRNATVEGQYANWLLQNGGCMEFTDSNDFSQGGSISMGGQVFSSNPDNSKLYINDGIIMSRIIVAGRDDFLNATLAVFEQGVFLATSLTYYPKESGSTRVFLTDSLVPTLALAFGGPSQPTQISNLKPGVIKQWDFQNNLSLPQIPYDVSLNNVTLIPNSAGTGDILGGGWGLNLSPGGPSANLWPELKVSNSEIGYLGLQGCFCGQTQHIRNVGLPFPVTETLLGTINFANSTIEGLTELSCNSCNVTLSDVDGLALYATGTSNISFVNSSVTEYFNTVGCSQCSFTFSGNSTLGNLNMYNFTKLPYYELLPNASYWSQYSGSAYVVNSTLSLKGNVSLNLFGPDGAKPVPYFTFTDSTVVRTYPILTLNQRGNPLPNVTVSVSSSKEELNLTTDNKGSLELSVTYTSSNYTQSEQLSAKTGTLAAAASVGLMSNAPVDLILKQSVSSATPQNSTSTSGQSQIATSSQKTSTTRSQSLSQTNQKSTNGSATVGQTEYTSIAVVVGVVGVYSMASLAVKRNHE